MLISDKGLHNSRTQGNTYLTIKRIIDLLLSIAGLIVLSPLLIIVIVTIRIDSRGAALYRQKRVGINKEIFSILKFRSMFIDSPRDTPTHLLEKPEQYITRVGRVLRKTSMDELPQLINIMQGSMSIVGPRPALWNQTDLISERDKYGANNVLPGLTGWAQINGRGELTIIEKARLDGEYVKRMSLGMDAKCIWRTICLLIGRGNTAQVSSGDIEHASARGGMIRFEDRTEDCDQQ